MSYTTYWLTYLSTNNSYITHDKWNYPRYPCFTCSVYLGRESFINPRSSLLSVIKRVKDMLYFLRQSSSHIILVSLLCHLDLNSLVPPVTIVWFFLALSVEPWNSPSIGTLHLPYPSPVNRSVFVTQFITIRPSGNF